MFGLCDEVFDGVLYIDDVLIDITFELLFVKFGEEVFDGIELGIGCGYEVEDEVFMLIDLCLYFGMFVGGIFVDDDVYEFVDCNVYFDGIDEVYEFLMVLVLYIVFDYCVVYYVEGVK